MQLIKALLSAILLFVSSAVAAVDADPLHKRKFNTSLTETRNGVAKKPVPDLWEFRNGKVHSEFIQKKFGFKWVRYRINKDSVYTDSTDTEVRLLEIEANATDETNQTVLMEFTVLEWDLDGIVRITKNDRPKKYYGLVGREKAGSLRNSGRPKAKRRPCD
jgi:hypothetical protein